MSYVFVKVLKPALIVGTSVAVGAYTAYGYKQWGKAETALHIKGMNDKQLQDLFDAIDEDHNGKIDEKELSHALTRGGLKASRINVPSMISAADDNHDGFISKEEFVHICKRLQSENQGR